MEEKHAQMSMSASFPRYVESSSVSTRLEATSAQPISAVLVLNSRLAEDVTTSMNANQTMPVKMPDVLTWWGPTGASATRDSTVPLTTSTAMISMNATLIRASVVAALFV